MHEGLEMPPRMLKGYLGTDGGHLGTDIWAVVGGKRQGETGDV